MGHLGLGFQGECLLASWREDGDLVGVVAKTRPSVAQRVEYDEVKVFARKFFAGIAHFVLGLQSKTYQALRSRLHLAKGGGDVVCRFEGEGDRAFALDFLVSAGGWREVGHGCTEDGCLAGGEELRSCFVHLLRALHVCAVNVGVEGRQSMCPVDSSGMPSTVHIPRN